MANGIGRLITLGIAKQSTFDTAAGSPVFTLPVTNTAKFEYTINKEENNAALGSGYEVNKTENTTQFATISPEVKVDEDHIPLLFGQRYSISTTTASGETSVYQHTLTHSNTTNHYYTLFLQDDQRDSYIMKNALISTIELMNEQGFYMSNLEITGNLPEQSSVTNTISAIKEFVGRHTTFEIADSGSSTSAVDVRNVTYSHTFNLSSEDFNFALGSPDLSAHQINSDRAEISLTKNMDSMDNFDDYRNNQAKTLKINSTNSDREVTGSTNNTNPSIVVDVPVSEYLEYTDRDGDLDTQLSEELNFLALDDPGTSDTPSKITVVNAEDGTNY